MNASVHRTALAVLIFSLVGAGCFGTTEPKSPAAEAPVPQQQVAEPPSAAVSSTADTATSTASATSTAPAPVPSKPKTVTTEKPLSKTVVVTITDSKFSPQMIAVNAGDTVMWVNKDTVPHTSKFDGALLWDSGTIRPGGSYKRVFAQPGSYAYSCSIHPFMKGTVIVR